MASTSVVELVGHENARPGDVIGYWRHGPIHLIGGGAPDDDGDDDDQGGDDGDGDGDGDTGLLDDEGDQNGDDGDGGDDDGGSGASLTPEMRDLIAREANRIADRRINQIQERERRGGSKKAAAKSRRRDDGDGDDQGAGEPELREARLVYREYVGDQIRFMSDDERAMGMDLARALLPGVLAEVGDVEEAGRRVATQVTERVRGTRKSYEKLIIGRLKQSGALPKDWRASQQPRRGADRPGDQSQYAKGAQKAVEMFGDRSPAHTGTQNQS